MSRWRWVAVACGFAIIVSIGLAGTERSTFTAPGLCAPYRHCFTKPGRTGMSNRSLSEEFTGPTLDPAVWNVIDRGGRAANFEQQIYRPAAAAVQGGVLTLTADSAATGGYVAAEVDSQKPFRYGTFSARLRMPATPAAGLWPAFWLVNRHDDTHPPQEIDIAEWHGADPSHVRSNYIWSYSPQRQTTSLVDAGVDLSAGWHVYSVQWQPDSITWSIDGKVTKTWTAADAAAAGTTMPSDPMYLVLNFAVGSDTSVGGGTLPDTVTPAHFLIDWVHVAPWPN